MSWQSWLSHLCFFSPWEWLMFLLMLVWWKFDSWKGLLVIQFWVGDLRGNDFIKPFFFLIIVITFMIVDKLQSVRLFWGVWFSDIKIKLLIQLLIVLFMLIQLILIQRQWLGIILKILFPFHLLFAFSKNFIFFYFCLRFSQVILFLIVK